MPVRRRKSTTWASPSLGAFPAVDHQEDDVGFGHGLLGLAAHQGAHLVFAAHQAAGVHQEEGPVVKGEAAVMAVPGDPGDIGHQGLGRAGEAIEQGGLAHVGPADDGHQALRALGLALFVFRFAVRSRRHLIPGVARWRSRAAGVKKIND